ncbi:hypothetical protein EDB92DRAFT_2041170 [Lactarius akahatsu]|uniref:Uncharacterized protein n=1 Tax=Lactarius akahatsu TaxID=416441 RepID=A0AAD4LAM0_9AGAM|nr:hypothetical protein EDB92DRAFT_2041170 [Lactarius akahatsu]
MAKESVGREIWEAHRKGAGGAEGRDKGKKAVRGDGSAGRETEAERGRPRRESLTCDREEGFGRADREGQGAEVPKSAGGARSQGREHRRRRGRARKGVRFFLRLTLTSESFLLNPVKFKHRYTVSAPKNLAPSWPQHEKRSTLAARAQLSNIVSGLVSGATAPRGSASRATCNNRSTISSVPEMISMRSDKELSARIEIVSVWWRRNIEREEALLLVDFKDDNEKHRPNF